MADIDLRNAERQLRSHPSTENLLRYWTELARARQPIELSIAPGHSLRDPAVHDFLQLSALPTQGFESIALTQCNIFGVSLGKLFKQLFLICHNILFIEGWGREGNEAVEGSSPALTHLILRRVFWEPDPTIPGLGQFHCHMGRNHHFTIIIPYSALTLQLFLPLCYCPHCQLEILIINRDQLPTAQALLRMNFSHGRAAYNTEYLCINDSHAVQFDTHHTPLYNLVHQPNALWLNLPIPTVLDYPVIKTSLQQQRSFRDFPSSFDPQVASVLELPGLEDNGTPFFMNVVGE